MTPKWQRLNRALKVSNLMRFATLDEWLVWQEKLHPKSIDLGLSRVRTVYQALLPVREHPFTLTVGGTNGKGSSVAFLDSILRSQGYRVGAYTSPHLLRYNERIRVNGKCVEDEEICETFERIDRARGDISLSFFEFGTLAALDLFSKADLDVQVLEVGLGGRLDAVNVIDPDAALITAIDIDHRDLLGDKREAIALEKAGILRQGRPAIIGDPNPPDSLIDFARTNGIELSRQGKDFGFESNGRNWTWFGLGDRLECLPMPGIPGEHQLQNASAVIQLLRSVDRQRPVSEAAIRNGLETVKLAGRFQYIDGPIPVLVDVAHNPQAARILAGYLRTRFPGRRVHAVFAIMKDKDIPGVVNPLKTLVERWYLAPIPIPRAASESELRSLFDEMLIENVEGGFSDAQEAFAAAIGRAHEKDLLVVFGTFPLVSEFLAHNPQIYPR